MSFPRSLRWDPWQGVWGSEEDRASHTSVVYPPYGLKCWLQFFHFNLLAKSGYSDIPSLPIQPWGRSLTSPDSPMLGLLG